MAPHKTVTINGRLYDAVTGLPVESVKVTNPDKTPIKKPAPAPAKKPVARTSTGTTSAQTAHAANVQRSQTLHRRATKKPVAPQKVVTKRAAPGRHMDIARNADVSKFAKHPEIKAAAPVQAPVAASAATKKSAPKPAAKLAKNDKPAQVHPVAQRALHRSASKKQAAAPAKAQSAKEVKDAAITKALATPTAKPVKAKKAKKDRKVLRRVIIIGSALLILAVGIYAVYRLVPNISVSVAASQAGISATYPEFTPDGYALEHPVTYTDGEVDLKFASNSSNNYYTITQTRSSWDSSAVLDNVVTPVAGANYVTTKERGLTIYTYGSSAAWVNGGILYKIESKAPLSGDQIRRIATSL